MSISIAQRPGRVVFAALAITTCLTCQAPAAMLTWDGSTGNWDTDASWLVGGTEPTATDDAYINAGAVTVSLLGEVADELRLGTVAGTASLEINGGQLMATFGLIGDAAGSTSTATVTGANSTWTNTGALAIGQGGNGTLNVEAGGEVSNTIGNIGRLSGTTGVATVTGTNSTWTSTSLNVGFEGAGTLNVEAGGAVTNATGRIGRSSGSTGAVTVTGANSLWTNTGDLRVGDVGDGTLTVADGGAVSGTSSSIAFSAASTSVATVTGANSDWTHTGELRVGLNGNGTLNVEAGGAVSNTIGTIGVNPSGTGAATVTGAGSTWTNTDSLFVGGSSTGAGGTGTLTTDATGTVYVGDAAQAGGIAGLLTVSDSQSNPANGGRLVVYAGGTINHTGQAFLGHEAGEFGTAQVTGGGATWTNTSVLFVGVSGTGTLNVEDGGAVQNVLGIIGGGSGSTGTATVTGSNSTWTNTSGLSVGQDGAGTLNIADGGSVENASGSIGDRSSSTGTATVTGANSTWTNTSSLFVGRFGTGTLNIEDGGAVENINATIGNGTNITGTATVTGANSTWNNTVNLRVGGFGTGTLNVENGGAVQNVLGIIGSGSGSTGTATVTGTNSTWTNTDSLFVGGSSTGAGGTGTLITDALGTVYVGDAADDAPAGWLAVSDSQSNPANGGRLVVYAGGTINHTGSASLGDNAGEFGTAQVTGGGATWTNTSALFVGNSGTGTLNVEDGGAVHNGVLSRIGVKPSSTGTATVTGANSTWTNTIHLFVGDLGTGTLNVEDGGAVQNDVGFIGNFSGSTGTATVTGAGSTWTNTAGLDVGRDGDGLLNISSGGEVSNTVGQIARNAGSTGTATVTGAGSLWDNTGGLYVGGSDTAAGGTGTLNIQTGGTVDATGPLIIWAGGTVNLDGGTLNATSIDTVNGGSLNFNTGTLGLTGSDLSVDIVGLFDRILTVDANQTYNVSGDVKVGDVEIGILLENKLTIQGGGVVNNTTGRIGNALNSPGYVTVTGSGSLWDNSSELWVGNLHEGTLSIEDGGEVRSTVGQIGRNSAILGAVGVSGAGSTWTNTGGLFVGGSDTAAAGPGQLLIQTGGTVDVGDLKIWGSGSVHINGGTLVVNTLVVDSQTPTSLDFDSGTLHFRQQDIFFTPGASTTLSAGKTFISDQTATIVSGGTLDISGGSFIGDTLIHTAGGTFSFTDGSLIVNTFTGTLDQDGGTLAPGASPGVTTISADYNLNAGEIAIELGGLTPGTQHDQVNVTGALNLGLTSVLDVSLINVFAPSDGDSFDILNFGSITGSFGTINLPTLVGDLDWDTSNLLVDGTLSVFTTATLPGDLDGDGFVGINDLNIVLGNWNQNVPPANPLADPSGDGFVGIDDLNAVLGNWNAGAPPTSHANIPEPGVALILAVGALGLAGRRR